MPNNALKISLLSLSAVFICVSLDRLGLYRLGLDWFLNQVALKLARTLPVMVFCIDQAVQV
jgi:hypothetical protein